MDTKRLHAMANQIARNLAVRGRDGAVAATARHIHDYWDSGMKAAIVAGDRSGLDPIAAGAVEQLARN